MPLFTPAEFAQVKAAYLQALVDGIASANIGGQNVVGWTVDQWKKALDQIQQDQANASNAMGMRFRRTVPPATG